MKPVIEGKIRQALPLIEGSRAFNGWKYPPVNPIVFMRFFNLTNEAAFLSGKAIKGDIF